MDKDIHILIPTDFSPESVSAIDAMKQLSKSFPVKVSLLHILLPGSVSLGGAEGTFVDTGAIQPTYLKELHIQARKQVALQAEEHHIQTENQAVIIDNISSGIASYAEENAVDMIIMGTKQATGLVAWLNGSDTQVVARLSSIPLLTVLNGSDLSKIDRILYLHDCGRHPLVAPHPLIIQLQKIYGAQIHLLYVGHGDREGLEQEVDKYIKLHGLKNVYSHIATGSSIKKVLSVLETEHYDLLCMGTHGRNQIAQLFKRSVTEYMIGHSRIPILSYRL